MTITLNEYLRSLQSIVDENPQAGNLVLIFSHDDEGNAYQKVYNEPCICHAKNLDRYMTDEVYFPDEMEEHSLEPNAICIN